MQEIQYLCDDTVLTGWLADGSGGSAALGILIAHEARGLGPHVKKRAQMLADAGFVAFALDLYGATGFPLKEALRRHEEMMATPGLMFRRASAALDTLMSHPNVDADRLASIGFCQGGITSLELARGDAPIRCAIGFHPNLTRPAGSPDEKRISAKVLMMVGDADPLVPQSTRAEFAEEMNLAGADWQLHLFGGVGHSFTDPNIDSFGLPGFRYDALADRRSWNMMLELLREEFGIPGAENGL
jgi:dienelactone hydrolase